ncbi:MAG: ATP-binding cassette domain-containing protein [Treponema sp.]|nr:ATP-binding cassette domain-containing protein [Treponema sp.]
MALLKPGALIETDKVTKEFKTLTSLDNISIRVKEGEIYGFLGLNGAGKTTLIRVLLNMIKPTSGRVKFLETNLIKITDYGTI